MQTRTKSVFLLLTVLVLGMLVGILISGAMHNRRMQRIARIRTGPGIAQLVERAVEPANEEQRAHIRQIMESAAPRFEQVFQRTREEMRALSDSVMAELEAILEPEQMVELRRHMEMRRGPPPDERRVRQRPGRKPPPEGPPPGGPPTGAPPPPPE